MTHRIEEILLLRAIINEAKAQGKSVGFVPTMGALHEGHLCLVRQSKEENDFTVVSIYVNLRQFNSSDDFTNYPRNPEQDFISLQQEAVDVVYFPQTLELFSKEFLPEEFDLEGLDYRLEGASRPGHFKGVIEVVHALFQHVKPAKAYFGLKDFQQVAVIRKMVSTLNLPVKLVGVPTVRAENGLALSSRNQRLSLEEQTEALVLIRTLIFLKDNYGKMPINTLLASAKNKMKRADLYLDYLEIVDIETLIPLKETTPCAVACIAAYCSGVRLIDNMLLIAH